MGELIYKVARREEWEAALREGVYRGSPDDLRDGFIHFSREHQVDETLRKHFADESGLLLISVDAEALGESLRFEPSRGGELFPHLYGVLLTALAHEVVALL